MKQLKQLAFTIALTSLTVILPSAAIAANQQPTSKPPVVQEEKKLTFLFVLMAQKAMISQTDQGYELTLQGLDPKVLYISDRPARKGGFIQLSKFMSRWEAANSSFGQVPPNAIITHAAMPTDNNGIARAIGVELINPVKLSDNVWKFKLKSLNGKLSVGSYDGVSVFVDPDQF